MSVLRRAYYASWGLTVGIAFSVGLLRKILPEKVDDDACQSYTREKIDSCAPLIPLYFYKRPILLSFIIAAALIGMLFQLLVVIYGDPTNETIVFLMVYNLVSCLWPLSGKKPLSPRECGICGCDKSPWLRPQAVVVSVSFIFMASAFATYAMNNGEDWGVALLTFELLTTCMDLVIYVGCWGSPVPTNDTLTKRFTIDNDQQGYEIED